MQFSIPQKTPTQEITLPPKIKVFCLPSRFFSKLFTPHPILEVYGLHTMFFDLFCSCQFLNWYVALKNYFILGKGRGSRNRQNIQDLFIYFVSDETKTTLKSCSIPSLNLPVQSTYPSSTVTRPREPAFNITEKK